MCGIVPSIVVQMLLGHTIKMNTIYNGFTSTLWFLWSLICMTFVYGMLDIVAKKFSINLIIKWMLEIIVGDPDRLAKWTSKFMVISIFFDGLLCE